MKASYILAHDLGTSGNKATLFDADGHLVGSAFAAYTTAYPQPNWAEQEPADWWRSGMRHDPRTAGNEPGGRRGHRRGWV